MRGNIADRIIPNVISRHVRAIENVTRFSRIEERACEKKREVEGGGRTFISVRAPSEMSDTTAIIERRYANDPEEERGKERDWILSAPSAERTRSSAARGGKIVCEIRTIYNIAPKSGNQVRRIGVHRIGTLANFQIPLFC